MAKFRLSAEEYAKGDPDATRARVGIEAMCKAVRLGLERSTAARASGITVKVWRRVEEKAREGDAACLALVEAVDQAEAAAEVDAIEKVATSDDWRAAAWMAERLNPKRWALQVQKAAQERLDDVVESLRVRVGDEALEEAFAEAESGARRKAGA